MNKKTLISMVTGALVIGAASTTFAAANPFSDVPADSWAYDAVAKLASDGIVNGYPDGTYKGQNTMTRYEMAQIVAKAMTKTDMDKADKALVDKLAAEFSAELDNLGVRVADLEKKSDNVKWGGRLRMSYYGVKSPELKTGATRYTTSERSNTSTYELRLQPKMFIGNSGWTANARIRYYSDANLANNGGSTNGSTASDKSDTVIDRIYAEGPLFGADTKLGKLDTYSDDVFGTGIIMDSSISGAQFNWHIGDKAGKSYVKAVVGRYDYNSSANVASGVNNAYDGTGDYTSLEVGIAPKDSKLSGLVGYTGLKNLDTNGAHNFSASTADDSTNIWIAGAGYQFDKNVKLFGLYAKSSMDDIATYLGDDQSKAYDITLNYKGAKLDKPGSWGIYTAYRYLGEYATVAPTYDASKRGTKGWEIGATYTVAQNILATLRYYDGKQLKRDYGNNDADYNAIYARVEFFF